ncbi:hypothetical protein AFLA_009953 [Aspergillus flavus NRRL3357]|nr:hypothetical protein AFLA_009953 [Aspergillus flavus NRRL3357]
MKNLGNNLCMLPRGSSRFRRSTIILMRIRSPRRKICRAVTGQSHLKTRPATQITVHGGGLYEARNHVLTLWQVLDHIVIDYDR